MVHASLRKIGLTRAAIGEGGADLLIDALEDVLGPAGTLLMILGVHWDFDWINARHPAEERPGLLAGAVPFDSRTAPAMREIGWLAEAFRRRQGTRLSANPSGRFGARGRHARAVLAGQPWHDYYGPGSPLQKLCDRGGRILRIGADPDTVTALHYAEYLARLPNKKRVRWHYRLADEAGARDVFVDCLDDASGIVDWPGEDYFALILKAYLATGRADRGTVGHAEAELIDADDLVNFGARWMEKYLVNAET
ncbi:MAG: aminoglycoside N(3)-acetyltransferase [Sphingosinicella sp.]